MAVSSTVIKGIQRILSVVTGRNLVIDGIIGPATRGALARAPEYAVRALEGFAKSAGTTLNEVFKKAVAANSSGWAAKLFPVLLKEAKKAGLLPLAVGSQMVLESGWDPKPIGNSFNFGGLKYNSMKGYKPDLKRISARTKEEVGGVLVPQNDDFAAFDSIEDFAKGYVWYLTKSPSSRNYRGIEKATTVAEYADYLQDTTGGKKAYATDSRYKQKLVSVSKNFVSRYGQYL